MPPKQGSCSTRGLMLILASAFTCTWAPVARVPGDQSRALPAGPPWRCSRGQALRAADGAPAASADPGCCRQAERLRTFPANQPNDSTTPPPQGMHAATATPPACLDICDSDGNFQHSVLAQFQRSLDCRAHAAAPEYRGLQGWGAPGGVRVWVPPGMHDPPLSCTSRNRAGGARPRSPNHLTPKGLASRTSSSGSEFTVRKLSMRGGLGPKSSSVISSLVTMPLVCTAGFGGEVSGQPAMAPLAARRPCRRAAAQARHKGKKSTGSCRASPSCTHPPGAAWPGREPLCTLRARARATATTAWRR